MSWSKCKKGCTKEELINKKKTYVDTSDQEDHDQNEGEARTANDLFLKRPLWVLDISLQLVPPVAKWPLASSVGLNAWISTFCAFDLLSFLRYHGRHSCHCPGCIIGHHVQRRLSPLRWNYKRFPGLSVALVALPYGWLLVYGLRLNFALSHIFEL